jgi:hypothetical protein
MSYMYHPGKQEVCGENWLWENCAAKSEWQTLTMYVKMNNPGTSDGIQRVWLGGKKVLDRTDVLYRQSLNYSVEQFTFQNFHGVLPCMM